LGYFPRRLVVHRRWWLLRRRWGLKLASTLWQERWCEWLVFYRRNAVAGIVRVIRCRRAVSGFLAV